VVHLGEADWDCVGRTLSRADPDLAGELPFLLATMLDCLHARLEPGSTVAYLEAGQLIQSGCVLSDDTVVQTQVVDLSAPSDLSRDDRPGNLALRRLGVVRGERVDECSALGLELPWPPERDT
jgi:hypothetical protein